MSKCTVPQELKNPISHGNPSPLRKKEDPLRHSRVLSSGRIMDLDLTRMTTVSVDADAGQCVTVIYGSRETSAWSRENR